MKSILLSVLILLGIQAFSFEYTIYDMVKLKEYGITRDKSINNKLGVEFGQGYSGSYGPSIFFEKNQIVLSDFHNNRILWLNDKLDVTKIVTFDINSNVAGNTFRYYFDSDGIIDLGLHILGYTPDTGISIFEKKSERIVSKINFSSNFKSLTNYKSVFFHANVLFIHDKNGNLWSIKNPGLDQKKNKSNLLDEDTTIALINSGDLNGLTIDDKKRIFLNEELQTIDYGIFWNYYKELQKSDIKLSELEYEVSDKSSDMISLIGFDKNDQSYWGLGWKYILICGSNGVLFEIFEYDGEKSDSNPTVSPDGDIYFIDHARDKVTLYKIKREW